jgi:hypothetical protein
VISSVGSFFFLKCAGELHIIALIKEGTIQHKPTHTHT